MNDPAAPGGRRRAFRRSWAVWVFAATAVVALVALLVFGVSRLRLGSAGGSSEAGAGSTLPRVTIEHGEVVVTLPAAALERAGLRTAPLEKTSYRKSVRAYGTVVDLRGLLSLRDRYTAAAGADAAARARASASRREFERLRGLYRDDRNVSETALERAQATAAADRAKQRASAAPVQGLAALARQDFGPVLGGWVTKGAPALERLLAGRDVLIQVTLPPDVTPVEPPKTATIAVAGEPSVSARFVSPAVRTNPRIQGLVFYYVAPGRAGLLAGRNLVARFPVGSSVAGVRVPESAVVWLDGAAWIYVSQGPGRFLRREITTRRPVRGGYVVTGLAAGTPVVVRGAALLLSEEPLAANPHPPTEDEDTD